ncbi:hypothetical protein [Providencia heimbachae]|uniref:hypothetical protein n=1 Tax=Providencia heimbachae TaxID=333962 RepID=UPI000839A582|nr:hypothetical protein [Providencia heimbachae]NIH22151.1 hypothetical protein [Providencia heimbachae]
MVNLDAAIVHLTMYFHDTKLSTGTGAFYKRNDKYYIITAWHNVTGRNTETLGFIDKNNAVPDSVWVTFKFHVFDGYTTMRVKVPLYDDDKALFFIHPDNWPRVDVVAIPFDPFGIHITELPRDDTYEEVHISLNPEPGKCSIRTIQDFSAPDNLAQQWLDYVSVTEEVFIPSYPHNITDDRYSPVWKRATLASNPRNEWNRERKFLIDSASSSGMSGASVFYYDPSGVVRIGASRYHNGFPVAIHAGVYVGRLGVTSKADPQVGTVWHASLVDEIIDGATYDFLSHEIIINDHELEGEISNSLSMCSRSGIANILNENQPSRHYVLHEILKKIKGRASPSELMSLILSVAENYSGPYVPE